MNTNSFGKSFDHDMQCLKTIYCKLAKLECLVNMSPSISSKLQFYLKKKAKLILPP